MAAKPPLLNEPTKTIQRELNLYAKSGKLSDNLRLQESLKAVQPHFSISLHFCSKKTANLSDEPLNALCFLKKYFLRNDNKIVQRHRQFYDKYNFFCIFMRMNFNKHSMFDITIQGVQVNNANPMRGDSLEFMKKFVYNNFSREKTREVVGYLLESLESCLYYHIFTVFIG